MKLKKSHLKELIKQSIYELSGAEKAKKMGLKSVGFGNWKDPKTGQHYSTKDGKLQKVDSKDTKKKEKMVRNAAGDMVPASSVAGHPDFKKDDKPHPGERDPSVRASREKPEKEPSKPKIVAPMDNPFSKDDDLEKQTMKAATDANKKMEIDVLNKQADKGDGAQIDTEYGTVTWTSGDPDEDTFIATNEDGEEIEVDYNDIIRFHNDNDSVMKNLFGKSDDKPKEEPKRPKSMRDLDWDSELEPHEIEGWVQDKKFSIPNRVQFSLNKLVDKHADAYAEAEATGDYDKPNEIQKQIDQLLTKAMTRTGKSVSESVKKSVVIEKFGRRFTVKEVRIWMKTLEENRYKKIYNSDARRVAWMVNHIGENLENMPKSMRKKWTKAAYGRERYLAKEFLKSKKQTMAEHRLRKLIRKVVINEIRGVNEI